MSRYEIPNFFGKRVFTFLIIEDIIVDIKRHVPMGVAEMSTTGMDLGRILLSVQMLADEFEEQFPDCIIDVERDAPRLASCVMYCGQKQLREDLLYVLPESGAEDFPADRYSYIASQSVSGSAAHICGLNRPSVEILNDVIEIFRKYHDFEMSLSSVVSGGGSLSDLLLAADPVFHNPMYIHDNMFAVIALPRMVEGMLKFEYNENTGRIYIPLWLIEDFKFDENYRDTLSMHKPGIWGNDEYPRQFRSLFVNLWDGSYYCGRLLINELQSPLQPGQFQTAIYLAEYIMRIIRRDAQTASPSYRNFDDTFVDLINRRQVSDTDVNAMMVILGWREKDRYLCVRLRNQDEALNVKTITVLRSALSAILTGYVSFFYEKDLCIVLDLSVCENTYSEVRSILAAHVRDSYLYCGISNPFSGIWNLADGFVQTEIALNYISENGSMRWIMTFEDCAVPYLEEEVTRHMKPELVAAPDLLRLREYDRKNGTEYYETLRVYLLHERNIPETSDALIIHRTTLSYRLKKMREIMTVNLDSEDVRFYLLLSFRLLES